MLMQQDKSWRVNRKLATFMQHSPEPETPIKMIVGYSPAAGDDECLQNS